GGRGRSVSQPSTGAVEARDGDLASTIAGCEPERLHSGWPERLLIEDVAPAPERLLDVEVVMSVGLVVALDREERLRTEDRTTALGGEHQRIALTFDHDFEL